MEGSVNMLEQLKQLSFYIQSHQIALGEVDLVAISAEIPQLQQYLNALKQLKTALGAQITSLSGINNNNNNSTSSPVNIKNSTSPNVTDSNANKNNNLPAQAPPTPPAPSIPSPTLTAQKPTPTTPEAPLIPKPKQVPSTIATATTTTSTNPPNALSRSQDSAKPVTPNVNTTSTTPVLPTTPTQATTSPTVSSVAAPTIPTTAPSRQIPLIPLLSSVSTNSPNIPKPLIPPPTTSPSSSTVPPLVPTLLPSSAMPTPTTPIQAIRAPDTIPAVTTPSTQATPTKRSRLLDLVSDKIPAGGALPTTATTGSTPPVPSAPALPTPSPPSTPAGLATLASPSTVQSASSSPSTSSLLSPTPQAPSAFASPSPPSTPATPTKRSRLMDLVNDRIPTSPARPLATQASPVRVSPPTTPAPTNPSTPNKPSPGNSPASTINNNNSNGFNNQFNTNSTTTTTNTTTHLNSNNNSNYIPTNSGNHTNVTNTNNSNGINSNNVLNHYNTTTTTSTSNSTALVSVNGFPSSPPNTPPRNRPLSASQSQVFDFTPTAYSPTTSPQASPQKASPNTPKRSRPIATSDSVLDTPTRGKRARPAGDGAQVEKRLAPYKNKATVGVKKRIERAATETIYLVDQRVEDLTANDKEQLRNCEIEIARHTFYVLGTTGNLYYVTIFLKPSCDCPDFAKKREICKHIMFIYLKVLQVPETSDKIYQTALLSTELAEILYAGESCRTPWADERVREEFRNFIQQNRVAAQKPVAGLCRICFKNMSQADPITFCKTCGNNVHSKCWDMWCIGKTKKEINQPITCVHCKSPWRDQVAPVLVADAPPRPRATINEGYINMAGLQHNIHTAEREDHLRLPNGRRRAPDANAADFYPAPVLERPRGPNIPNFQHRRAELMDGRIIDID